MRFLLTPSSYALSDPSSIPNLLVQHLTIVGISMGIAILIALPLAKPAPSAVSRPAPQGTAGRHTSVRIKTGANHH